MTEPENLVLDHLRGIRADMRRTADDVRTLEGETTALRQEFFGVATLQEHDHDDIAALKARVERRLELTD